MSIKRRVIKPRNSAKHNASYVDIGGFAKGMAKNRIRRASDILPLYANLFLPESFFFQSELDCWLSDAENYLSLFYSKNFSDGPNYTHFKMKNSIGYTTKL
jgi:peptide/nickel transport system substrate-binding protein